MARTRAWLGLVVLAGTTACGAELSSSEWVHEPERGGALGQQQLLERDDAIASFTSRSAPSAGPQRLDHTITLGEVTSSAPTGAGVPAPAPGGTSVTVNVTSYAQPAQSYGYGEIPVLTSGGNVPTASAPRASRSSSTQPGQDWPAPVSHGPAFPYKTGPASPWEAPGR
jgi:hypothetical protein